MATDTPDRLRELLAIAERAGADRAWLAETALQVARLLADQVTVRRLEALQEAHRQAELIEALRRDGATLKAACAQAGITTRTHQRRRRGDRVASPIGEALRSWSCPPAADSPVLPMTRKSGC